MKIKEEEKRVYFRSTTSSQRKMLFNLVQEGYTIKLACIKSRMSVGSYYYWLPRFKEEGYAGLENFKSKAPKNHGNKKSKYFGDQVLELKRTHPQLGKRSIANLINKEHNWNKVISASTVRNIILKSDLQQAPIQKKKPEQKVKHADYPNQAVNIDFAFVKQEHLSNQIIPAVSGSSGKLKDPIPTKSNPQWPGQSFNNENLNFAASMDKYVEEKSLPKEKKIHHCNEEDDRNAVIKKKLEQEEEKLRGARKQIRAQRKLEDTAYKSVKKEYSEATQQDKKLTRKEKVANEAYMKDRKIEWETTKKLRQERKQRREEENKLWREERNNINEKKSKLPVTTWFAILIIIDNCTRKTIELPLFANGVHTTANATAQALKKALPLIEYLISDRGVHFKNKWVAELAQQLGFKQVFVGPYRPQTNGIAERFVRTLKEWLLDKTWTTEKELLILLEKFKSEYNDRPHQAKELDGLSPNEYGNRLLRA